MEIEVTTKRENTLLARTEFWFTAKHPGEKSPSREALRAEIAKLAGKAKDTVVIDHARSQFGMPSTKGYAKVYLDKEAALRVERKHILQRNGLVAREAKEEKPKAAPPPKAPPRAVEKKAEAKPEPKPEAKPEPAPAKKEEKKAEPAPAKKEEKKPPAKKEAKR